MPSVRRVSHEFLASGTGSRFGGAAANVEAFTETQWVTVRPDIADYPF